jgi:hypothetical protein
MYATQNYIGLKLFKKSHFIYSYRKYEMSNVTTQQKYTVACGLKAGISEEEQMSIAGQRFNNTHICGNE